MSRGRRRDPATLTREELAHRAVADAIRAGTLVRPETCELCSNPAQNAHHHSYLPEHHLDVAWVCDTHHGAIHSGKVAEPRTGEVRTGLRKKQPVPQWVEIDKIVDAIFQAYPRTPPFMPKERAADGLALLDRECSLDWRGILLEVRALRREEKPIHHFEGWRTLCGWRETWRRTLAPLPPATTPDPFAEHRAAVARFERLGPMLVNVDLTEAA